MVISKRVLSGAGNELAKTEQRFRRPLEFFVGHSAGLLRVCSYLSSHGSLGSTSAGAVSLASVTGHGLLTKSNGAAS